MRNTFFIKANNLQSVIIVMALFWSSCQSKEIKTKESDINKSHDSNIDTITNVESGSVVKYYEDGSKESEGALKNGAKHGVAKLYYPSGTLKQKGMWQNNKQEGLWEFYDEKGNLTAKVNFKNDLQHGLSIFYFSNKTISEKTHWKNGKVDGLSIEYYADGTVKRESKWKEGVLIEEQLFDSVGRANSLKDKHQ